MTILAEKRQVSSQLKEIAGSVDSDSDCIVNDEVNHIIDNRSS